jgi:hypothetical protein
MLLPSPCDEIVSIKGFACAMTSLRIALRIDLDCGYWAMAKFRAFACPRI